MKQGLIFRVSNSIPNKGNTSACFYVGLYKISKIGDKEVTIVFGKDYDLSVKLS